MKNFTKSFMKNLSKYPVFKTASFIAECVPDTYKFSKGEMSGGQYAKNTACRVARVGGSAVDAILGAVVGTVVLPGAGTLGCELLGGVAGRISSSLIKKVI